MDYSLKHPLYSVFKHESFNGVKFGVQFPKGVMGFKTKRQAQKVADAALLIAQIAGKRTNIDGVIGNQ